MLFPILKINEKTINGRVYDQKVAEQMVEQINGGKIMVKNGPDYTSDTIGQCMSSKIEGDQVMCEIRFVDSYIEELFNSKNGRFKVCGVGDTNNHNKVKNYTLSHLTTSF